MAKFVLAGSADCPYFAKAEFVADYLAKNLPDFKIHKIMQLPQDWEQWLQNICLTNGWKHKTSPIVWRELVNRGGKGILLGGFNDFLDYAQGYYGLTADMNTQRMLNIAEENLKTKQELMEEEAYNKLLIKPYEIWITGALNPTVMNVIPTLVSGNLLGEYTEISINLLDISDSGNILHGFCLEIFDMAWPLVRKITMHYNLKGAFVNAQLIIILDDIDNDSRQPIEERHEELAERCKYYGRLIERSAKPSVRVLVAGNSIVNLKTYFIMQNAPSVPRYNFVAVASRLEGEARSLLARKLDVTPLDISNITVWGNISRTIFIDLNRARVHRFESATWGPPTYSRPVLEVLHDRQWIEKEFLPMVYERKSLIERRYKHPLGISTACQLVSVLHSWYHDSPPGEILSLGVISEGQFGIPPDVIFSMPVRFCSGNWVVQTQIKINEEAKEKLNKIASELILEKKLIYIPPSPPPVESKSFPEYLQLENEESVPVDTLDQELLLEDKESTLLVDQELPLETEESIPLVTEEEQPLSEIEESFPIVPEEEEAPSENEESVPIVTEEEQPPLEDESVPVDDKQ
ncbi:putative malate dehydrogenase 1B [Callorhinchus milii]|uniref:Putative malate dehydrogenase 1B n=1 Tax=Callorhinchus milii TaxID=7868 RepID=A0A4W3H522_CALMI|nr:putative malate dehydrogenase 1B [Callorhinchus milii]|eukprot:gi/632946908/ref/XP_007888793.1/ PREDICTED: putative malate dehydrogenase 1B [Callorhinchus milii]